MADEESVDLTEKETAVVDGLLDTFDELTPKVRVAAFEGLLANYCHECGEEQPDDPEQECPCTEALDGDDEDDDTDEDDLDDEDDEDDEDEEEDDA